ncbi:hypothetical protein ABTL95_20310, partial [Acinetobacter baumannii]
MLPGTKFKIVLAAMAASASIAASPVSAQGADPAAPAAPAANAAPQTPSKQVFPILHAREQREIPLPLSLLDIPPPDDGI